VIQVAYPSLLQPLVNRVAQALVDLGLAAPLVPGAVAAFYLQPGSVSELATAGLAAGSLASAPWVIRSPIALQLAAKQSITAMELAHQLAHCCNQSLDRLLEPAFNPNTMKSQPSHAVVLNNGWLAWPITTVAIAHWLQQLLTTPPQIISPGAAETRGSIDHGQLSAWRQWQLQYAHSRCGSLLQLAQREGWLELTKVNKHWQIVAPAQIPWLNLDQGAGQPRLWLQHPAELEILQQLLQFPVSLSGQRLSWGYSQPPIEALGSGIDCITPISLPNSVARLAGILQLGTSFEMFYRSCQIWGDVRTQTPELSLVRLGLIAVLQPVLELVLNWLGIPPLEEL
jgi:hypothetical protein